MVQMTNKSRRSAARRSKIIAKVLVPKRATEVVTEKTYTTTAPEVEIRKPATLAQALSEPAVAVVKPKKKVRKVIERRIRRAA